MSFSLQTSSRNVSKLLSIPEDLVSQLIIESVDSFSSVQCYFVYRSLTNQVNILPGSLEGLHLESRIELLREYIERHSFIGDTFPSYNDVKSKVQKGFWSTLKHSSMRLYLSDKDSVTSDCLFPVDKGSMSDYNLYWINISSAWVNGDYRYIKPKRIKVLLSDFYDFEHNSNLMSAFVKDAISSNMDGLVEMSKYYPMVVQKGDSFPTWNKYNKHNPISKPLPCLSPLGFDFMALLKYGYLSSFQPIYLW